MLLIVCVVRGESEDIVELVRPVFGSWWPSWSIHSLTLSSCFFSGIRQPGFLYRLPGSAIAHRQSLSNACIRGISLEDANVLCKLDGVNAKQRESCRVSSEHLKYHSREHIIFAIISSKNVTKCTAIWLTRVTDSLWNKNTLFTCCGGWHWHIKIYIKCEFLVQTIVENW